MKKDDKKSKVTGFDAEAADSALLDGVGTASASEATGMMYCPPRSEDELRSREHFSRFRSICSRKDTLETSGNGVPISKDFTAMKRKLRLRIPL